MAMKPEGHTETPRLNHLQPAQYLSWLRKAHDPEWDEEKYGCSTRSKSELAAVKFALELEDVFARLAALQQANERMREALRRVVEQFEGSIETRNDQDAIDEARAALAEAGGETGI